MSTATATRPSNLDAALLDLPEVRQFIAKAKREELATLQAAETAIPAITAQELADVADLRKKDAAADAKVRTAEAALEKALNERREIRTAIHNTTHRAEAARRQHHRRLAVANADTAATWIARFEAESAQLRSGNLHQTEHEKKHVNGYELQVAVAHNRPSIAARISAIAEARHEALRICETQAEPEAALQALWDGLPAIQMEKVR